MEEANRWALLQRCETTRLHTKFFDSDGLLNEFEMMWDLRERFPLHFFVFNQTACHLAHEANVEQAGLHHLPTHPPTHPPTCTTHLPTCTTHACCT